MNALQHIHIVQGIAPVADAFAGTVRSDLVDCSNFHKAYFLIVKGVGATGTSTITIEAHDTNSPDNVGAVPFRYRKCTSSDTWGAWTAATSAGFATTAGSAHMYQIEVDTVEIAKIGADYRYLSLKAVEVVNDPVLAGVTIILAQPRFSQTVQPSVLD